MKFLFFIIILTCIGATAFMFFYFDSKIKGYKRNILTLNNQIYKLRASIKKQEKQNTSDFKEISVYYRKPNFHYGITLPYTSVYLSPIDNSFIINKIKDKLQVKLIEECELDKEVWYFIDLGLNTTLNSKGWIKKSQFSMFIDKQIDLSLEGYS